MKNNLSSQLLAIAKAVEQLEKKPTNAPPDGTALTLHLDSYETQTLARLLTLHVIRYKGIKELEPGKLLDNEALDMEVIASWAEQFKDSIFSKKEFESFIHDIRKQGQHAKEIIEKHFDKD